MADLTSVAAPAGAYADLAVLVVDDDPIIQHTLTQQLLDVGVGSVREASDGESALREVALAVPDLILCDVNMKPMDGIELLQRLRSIEGTDVGSIKFVFLTADRKVETVRMARDLRADGYLVKPVAPEALTKRLHSLFVSPPSLAGRRTGVVWN